MNKTIGIVGGMGPLATCDLFRKIIDVTEAGRDQDHVRVAIDSNTEIADRTAAILHGGADPVPEMVKSARRLRDMGADVLIMPCNTAHYFYPQVSASVDVPFLHMIRETADAVKKMGIRKVGLLATDGTIQSGVYKKVFEPAGISMLTPDPEGQKEVMGLIYDGVKAGNYRFDTAGFLAAVDRLEKQGAEAMILGCTELPCAMDLFRFSFKAVDPTLILASRAVQFLGVPVKEGYRF